MFFGDVKTKSFLIQYLQILGDNNAAKATPKMATIGGVRFYRSKNGNLYRSGIVKAQRYAIHSRRTKYPLVLEQSNLETSRKHVVKKIDELCKIFSTTGSSFLSRLNISSDTATMECKFQQHLLTIEIRCLYQRPCVPIRS